MEFTSPTHEPTHEVNIHQRMPSHPQTVTAVTHAVVDLRGWHPTPVHCVFRLLALVVKEVGCFELSTQGCLRLLSSLCACTWDGSAPVLCGRGSTVVLVWRVVALCGKLVGSFLLCWAIPGCVEEGRPGREADWQSSASSLGPHWHPPWKIPTILVQGSLMMDLAAQMTVYPGLSQA